MCEWHYPLALDGDCGWERVLERGWGALGGAEEGEGRWEGECGEGLFVEGGLAGRLGGGCW